MANEVPWPLLFWILRSRAQDFAYGSPSPGLLDSWLEFDLGDRVDRTHHLVEHPTEDVRLEVEGYSEVIRHRGWTAELNAEPYDPWQIGKVSDPVGGVEDEGRLTGDALAAIRAALTSTALTIDFDPNVYRWTTDAGDFSPALGVRLGGEQIDVTGIATTAATFVAAGAAAHADNAAVTPALFAGHAAGDWIVVVARIRSASTGVLVGPPGYTLLNITGHTASDPMQVWVKVDNGSESDPTVTPTGGAAGDSVTAVTLGFRNMPVSLSDLNSAVIDAEYLSNASAQNVAFPGTVVRKNAAPIDGAVVLLIGGKDDDWTSVATAIGFTEAVDTFTTLGNDQGLVIDYLIQTTATAVGNDSFVVTGGANAVSEGIALAIAGGYQTMTVRARSLNGVVKSHAASTVVEVNDALVLGL